MRALSLNRKSWHYWLACNMFGWQETSHRKVYSEQHGYRIWQDIPNDFCSYIRRLVGGTLLALMILTLALIGIAAAAVAEYRFFQYAYWAWICGFDIVVTNYVVIGGLINFVALGGLFVFCVYKGWLEIFAIPNWIKWCFRWVHIPKFRIPDCDEIPLCDDTRRFIVAAYHTVHDKVCFKLEFRDDNNVNNG